MDKLVILIGYRGVGKTTLGKKLAKSLGYRFYDTDDELCRQEKIDISTIVEKEGWQGFRLKEKQLLASLAECENTVVSTGGGAVLHQEVWQELKNCSTIFWLTADHNVLIDRLTRDSQRRSQRPSLTGEELREEVIKLLKEREPLYDKIAHYRIDTATQEIDEAVKEMRKMLMEKIG